MCVCVCVSVITLCTLVLLVVKFVTFMISVCTISNCISVSYNYYYLYIFVQIALPESVTGRYFHSLTAVTMSPHCVWLVIVGGYGEIELRGDGGGVKKGVNIFIEDTNRLIMIIELSKSYCNTFNQFAL